MSDLMHMTLNTTGFFIQGNCSDPAYKNIRDHPAYHEARQFIDLMWNKYKPLADSNFRTDAKNHFQERFWEMYLAVSLAEKGLNLFRVGGEGPEFYFEHGGKRVWVEAITPGPGTGSDHVPELQLGVVNAVPTEKILLRFTHALVTKQEKYLKALAKGIVSENDAYLLAINSREIRHTLLESTMPSFIKAFLPIGSLAVAIDPNTRDVVESSYQYRGHIEKLSGENVSTRAFLDSEFAFCSAVLHSSADCLNRPTEFGGDFCVLHNPVATYQIDQIVFSGSRQFSVQDNELIES